MVIRQKLIFVIISCCFLNGLLNGQPIDRKDLVQRHNVHVRQIDSLSSLSVGNGNFAFTVDATGMQSFPDAYANGVPLGTQSVWGWHSFSNTKNLRIEEAQKEYVLEGRKISYTVQPKEPERAREAVEYFRVNPHRLQLGNIGLELIGEDGSIGSAADIREVDQQLDLWAGIITSTFLYQDVPVKVTTVCNQELDAVSFRVESDLLLHGRLRIRIRFPYPNGQFKDVGNNYKNPERHLSILQSGKSTASIRRDLDSTRYYCYLDWEAPAVIKGDGHHNFLLLPARGGSGVFSFSCTFNSQHIIHKPIRFDRAITSSIRTWEQFWMSGGAVDFSGSTDPRAAELERRVILSQYLTRIQCSGAFPPQETGLTYNSWYGKPHLEMLWWHAVHFALWGRPELLQKSLDWYRTVAVKARAIAKRQGFEGFRWQKMTDNEGDESPSSVGAFLIWQQPHFIYMAELLYRSHPSHEILEKYSDLVFATANFMASFPSYDSTTHRYNLGRGLIPAQECFDAFTTFNPTYELAYWTWALQVAQQWRHRLGMENNSRWERVIKNLAPLPQANGVYLATESTPDCYEDHSKYLTDHPAVLGAYATLPAVHGLDTMVMRRTLALVLRKWNWDETWGWDFPLTAMTAARLHEPELAVQSLLMPVTTNTYLVNGHNYQDQRLTIYLPGNGGLLGAVALMCTGTDADTSDLIGFPRDGTWKVRWEGLKKIF